MAPGPVVRNAGPGQVAAIRIIHDEHLAISAVLYGLRFLARPRSAAGAAEVGALHAMLDYIVEYPDRWHHPKESRYLFRRLLERDPSACGLIDGLEAEHREGEARIATLARALTAFERDRGDPAPFAGAVEDYARFQWEHIRKEEDVLMPRAQRALTDDDWTRLAAAFAENDHPPYGVRPKDEAARLYRRILDLAPAPIGHALRKTLGGRGT